MAVKVLTVLCALAAIVALLPCSMAIASDTSADDVFAQTDEPEKFRVPIAPPQNLTQNEYFDLAKRYIEVEWPEQAQECITKVEKLGPNTPLAAKAKVLADTRLPKKNPPKDAIVLNIKAFKGYGGPAVAKKTAAECIQKFPDFEYGYITLAKLNEMDHAEVAVENYRKAIKINPHNTLALFGLGERLIGLKQFNEAKSVFQDALKYDPDDPFYSGQRIEQMHLYEEAASPLEQFKTMALTIPAMVLLPQALKNRDEDALKTSGFIDHQGKFAFHQLNTVQGRSFSNGCWINYNQIFDRTGKQISTAKFAMADDFSEGMSAASSGNLWGYLNTAGTFCIKPAFRDAKTFHAGLAPAKSGELWGYIDKDGHWSVPPKFDGALSFSDGLAAVALDGKVGYIDTSGRFVIKPQYDAGHSFSEGRAVVTNCETAVRRHHDYCIDKTGKIVFDWTKTWQDIAHSQEYPSSGHFSIMPTNDLLAAEDAMPKSKMGINGPNQFINFQLNNMHSNYSNSPQDNPELYSEGLVVLRCGDKIGYLDKNGHLAIPCKFGWASVFKEGLAAVSLDSPPKIPSPQGAQMKFGYIDKTGKFVIPARFVRANGFHEGVASVRDEKGDGGFVDHSGKLVIPVPGGFAGDFHDGLAAVGAVMLYP